MPVHVRQPETPALKTEIELLMVDPEKMQNRRLKIVHVDRVFGDIESKIVGLAVLRSRLDP